MFMEEHIYVESSVCTHGNSKIEPVATVAAVAAVVAVVAGRACCVVVCMRRTHCCVDEQ